MEGGREKGKGEIWREGERKRGREGVGGGGGVERERERYNTVCTTSHVSITVNYRVTIVSRSAHNADTKYMLHNHCSRTVSACCFQRGHTILYGQ